MTRKINPEHDKFYVYLGNFSITSFDSNTNPAYNSGNKYFDNIIDAKIFQLSNILYNERDDTWYSEWEKHSVQDIKNMQDELDILKEKYPEKFI